jgi:rod shape-determining protein MreC
MPRFLKDRKNVFIVAGLLLAQLVLISLQVPLGDQPSYFKKGLFFVLSPIEKAIQATFVHASAVWNRYFYLRGVVTQNQGLRDELFHLRQENLLLRNELQKLQDKQEIERFLSSLQTSFCLASVIGVDATNIYKSVVIDKGARSGLKSNMPVLDREGYLVGRVVNPISLGTATVQLITDDSSAVGVYSEMSEVRGVLGGDAKNGRNWLKYVPATDTALIEGEELRTSGVDKIFPSGIKVGRVMSVTTDGSLFKKISVRPYADFKRLKYVAILTQTGYESY